MAFLKLQKTELLDYMLEHQHDALILVTLIAKRARRSVVVNDGIQIGESKIGDYWKCGLTRQRYRSTINFLTANQIITIRTTNKGTIAKLCDTRVYDINTELDNHQNNPQITNKQPTDNQQITTNKKEEEGRRRKEEDIDIRISHPLSGDSVPRAEDDLFTMANVVGVDSRTIRVSDKLAGGEDGEQSAEAHAKGNGEVPKPKKRKENFVRDHPPALADVQAYWKEHGFAEADANWFYDYFTDGNWVDSNGKPVRNWRQKALTHMKHKVDQ